MKVTSTDFYHDKSNSGKKARVDVVFDDDFTVRGFQVFENQTTGKLFVKAPTVKSGNKYVEQLVFVNDYQKKKVNREIIKRYHATL